MEHQLEYRCHTNSFCGSCMGCNLPVCQKCGLYEGGLTTDCPGEIVSEQDTDRIYKNGDLDYRGDEWVNKPNPYNQSVKIGRDMDELKALRTELNDCKKKLAIAITGRCPTCEIKSEEIRDILFSVGISRATAPVDGVKILAQIVTRSRELLKSLGSIL